MGKRKALKPNGRLGQAIAETREHLELNSDPDASDWDAMEYLMDDCGQDRNGYCSKAGSEECDFECPFS